MEELIKAIIVEYYKLYPKMTGTSPNLNVFIAEKLKIAGYTRKNLK